MAHILLVVADATLSNLISERLYREGHTVDQYSSYECALRKFRLTNKQYPYSVVIVDHFLPETDGGTFADQVNGIMLVKDIINKEKIWKKQEQEHILKNNFIFYCLSYRLCPEIIFLASSPEALEKSGTKLHFNRLLQKEKSGKFKKYSPVTLLYKGKELCNELKFKVTELEIYYWRRIFAISMIGFGIQAISALCIALWIIGGKILTQIVPEKVVYLIVISLMQIALFFSQVYPKLPTQAISQDRIRNIMNNRQEGKA